MKRLSIILLMAIATMAVLGQGLVSSTPAKLQVFMQKSDGSEALMSCDNLTITYSQLTMNGEIQVKALVTDDVDLQALINETPIQSIRFKTVLPEEEFVFRDNYHNNFTTEAELSTDNYTSRIILNFDVSNRNTSLANTFAISCTGNLFLLDHLGITAGPYFSDNVSFLFFQNVRVLNY